MANAVKVFKKTTPNTKVTVYLSKRDFTDHLDHTDPVDGVVVLGETYLQNRKLFGQIITVYRYGREEDETMGLKFSKEMIVAQGQIVPSTNESQQNLTRVQQKLLKKLPDQNPSSTVQPFTFHFPKMAPCSVTLQSGEGDDTTDKPLGVEYYLKVFVGENDSDPGHRRSSVALAIKKLVQGPIKRPLDAHHRPTAHVSKGFTFSTGKINLEVELDHDVYYHGETITANISIRNNSKKTVRNIKACCVQHCEVTMVNGQFTKNVAGLETREGCPITPGASLAKTVHLKPAAAHNRDRRGVALDGRLRDDDANLASSTMLAEGVSAADAIGVVISYTFRVKVNCGTLGGELVADVPFKLFQAPPGVIVDDSIGDSGNHGVNKGNRSRQTFSRMMSAERKRGQSYENDDDDDENIIFEDFARFRQSRDGMD